MSDRRSPDRLVDKDENIAEEEEGGGGQRLQTYWMRIYAAPAVAEEAKEGGKKLCDGRSNSAVVPPLDASSARRRDSSR